MTIAGKMTDSPPSAAIFSANPAAWRAGRVTRTPSPDSGPADLSVDKAIGATSAEVGGERASERVGFLFVANRGALFAAQHIAATLGREETAQPELVMAEDRVRRERRVTVPGETPRKRALRGCRKCRL